MTRKAIENPDNLTVLAKGRTADHDYLAVAPPLTLDEVHQLRAAKIGINSLRQFERATVGIECDLISFEADRSQPNHVRRVHQYAYEVEAVLRGLGRRIYIQNQVFELKGRKSSPFTPETIALQNGEIVAAEPIAI